MAESDAVAHRSRSHGDINIDPKTEVRSGGAVRSGTSPVTT